MPITWRIGASIGVAASAGTDDAEALLELAGSRMYQATRRASPVT